MTTDAANASMENYVGLDFGTSNSSICLLGKDTIELVDKRSNLKQWSSLSDTLTELPYPAAIAVRRFLAEHDTAAIFDSALQAYEACLAVLAYSMAADALYEDPAWRGLANLQHRSLGPLKGLLETSMDQKTKTGCVKDPKYVERMRFLKDAVKDFTEGKHHQASQVSPKWVEYVEEIACVTAEALAGNFFGYCATSNKVPYKDRFEGAFTVAHDQPPFVHHYSYSSTKAIDPTVVLMFDPKRGRARSLTPLLVWHRERRNDQPICCVLDRIDRRQYKPCHMTDSMAGSDINPGLPQALEELLEQGRFVTGEIDLKVSELGGVGEDRDG